MKCDHKVDAAPVTLKEAAELWGVTVPAARARVYKSDLVPVGRRKSPAGGMPANLYARGDLDAIAPRGVCPECKRVVR